MTDTTCLTRAAPVTTHTGPCLTRQLHLNYNLTRPMILLWGLESKTLIILTDPFCCFILRQLGL
jgi:hypothetical protein